MSDNTVIEKLWEIKGERSFEEMAGDIEGLTGDGLRRIMVGNRGGRMDTWQKIFAAYPELAPLFLSQNRTVVGPDTTTVGGDGSNA